MIAFSVKITVTFVKYIIHTFKCVSVCVFVLYFCVKMINDPDIHINENEV